MVLVKADCGFPHNFLWKTKILGKNKVCLWLVNKKGILTKDNLLRRGRNGDKTYVFYGQEETVDHLFLSCSIAKLIWSLLRCAFDIASIPVSLHDCFSIWIKTFPKCEKQLVLVGIFCVVLVHLET